MNVTIQVTKDDIFRGIRRDPRACPIAIAMARMLGDRFGWVDRVFAAVDDYVVPIPTNASVFMRAFDNGLPVLPFDFAVDLSDSDPEEDAP